MDDNCGELVECIGLASGCGEQEAGVHTSKSRHGPNVLQNLPIILFCTAYYFYLLFPFLIPLFP